ncbi:MAG: hypothetical protein GX591_11915 [Planctomycetes bacterium]|nr:hypothetical protein [Planctomycetota bacterium]
MNKNNEKIITGLTRGVVERDSDDAKHRFIPGSLKNADLVERRAWFVASTIEVDRHGEVVLPSAFDAKAFLAGHSPFVAGHQLWNESGLPTQIGTIFEAAQEADRVTIGVDFATTVPANEHWKLVADPKQKVACSVGFIPVRWTQGSVTELVKEFPELAGPFKRAGFGSDIRVRVYTQVEWLETSQVTVASNRLAMQMAKALADAKDPDAIFKVIGKAITEEVMGADMAAAIAKAMENAIAAAVDVSIGERLDAIELHLDDIAADLADVSNAIAEGQLPEAIFDDGDDDDDDATDAATAPSPADDDPGASESGGEKAALAAMAKAVREQLTRS